MAADAMATPGKGGSGSRTTSTGRTISRVRSGADAGDGRKRRWREHKLARREELVASATNAIRVRGPNAGMDEIAQEIGISKTVLYRYFTDKADLVTAVLDLYVSDTLAPRLMASIQEDADEYNLIRTTIGAYVDAVAADPNLYLFFVSQNSGNTAISESEQTIAELVVVVVGERLRALAMDSGGANVWGYGLVGSVRLAVHWWITHQSMSKEALVDYLVMMIWGGVAGVAASGASPAVFNQFPHPLQPMPAAEAARVQAESAPAEGTPD